MSEQKKPIVHIMVDLETFGVVASSAILSIGACTFDLDCHIPQQTFYRVLDIEKMNGTFDPSTIKFWLEQAFKGNMPPLDGTHSWHEAIKDFCDWVDTVSDGAEPIIWANGSDFDLPKLDFLVLHLHGGTTKRHWKHNSVRDCRTIFKLFGDYGIKPADEKTHNAIEDAVWQAKYLVSIIKNVSEFVKIKEFEDAYTGNVSGGVLSTPVGDATPPGVASETVESPAK